MLTLHTADLVLPMVREPIPAGGVVTDADRVVAVGDATELAVRWSGARVRHWPGMLLPGLVNAHAHLQYTDFADLAHSELPFPAWLAALTTRRQRCTDAYWIESTRRGVHAMLRAGTTAVADIVTNAVAFGPPARAGMAGVSYLEAVGQDASRWRAAGREAFVAQLDAAPHGRAVGVSPHTLYTLDTSVFADCVAIGRKRGLRTHTHLAESAAEAEYVAAGLGPFAEAARRFGLDMSLVAAGGHGGSPADLMASIEGLGPDVHVAHGVHCDPADRALLRRYGTTVAICVRSNAILGAGEPPIAAYLAEGSPLALGTDSLASSPSLDLLEEAAAAAALARRQGYGEQDLARRLVEAVTLGGAAAMGLSDVGRIVEGARADLAVFDVPVAIQDPYQTLLERGPGSCVATVLGGTIVHRGPAASKEAAGELG